MADFDNPYGWRSIIATITNTHPSLPVSVSYELVADTHAGEWRSGPRLLATQQTLRPCPPWDCFAGEPVPTPPVLAPGLLYPGQSIRVEQQVPLRYPEQLANARVEWLGLATVHTTDCFPQSCHAPNTTAAPATVLDVVVEVVDTKATRYATAPQYSPAVDRGATP